jgi:hypothetical protein
MANNGTQWAPPQWGTTDVLYGTGVMWYANAWTAVPADSDLGDSTKWPVAGWNYIGATEQGVTVTFTPRMTAIQIEEQPIPVAQVVDTATFTVETSLAEDTLRNQNLVYGNAGSISTVAQGVGQPQKQVLTFSTLFQQVAVALLGRNLYGFPRMLYIPVMMSTGTVKTDYRRAANKRMYPLQLSSLVNLTQIEVVDILQPAL